MKRAVTRGLRLDLHCSVKSTFSFPNRVLVKIMQYLGYLALYIALAIVLRLLLGLRATGAMNRGKGTQGKPYIPGAWDPTNRVSHA